MRWPTVPKMPSDPHSGTDPTREPAVEDCAQGRASYGGMVGSVGLTAGCQARRGVLCVIRRIAKKASQYTNAGPPKLIYTYPTPKHSVYLPPIRTPLTLPRCVNTFLNTSFWCLNTCLNTSFGVSTPLSQHLFWCLNTSNIRQICVSTLNCKPWSQCLTTSQHTSLVHWI